MRSNEDTHPKSASWAGPVGLLVAVGAAGLWLAQTRGADVPLGPAVGLLAVTAALGLLWLFRVRAARRFFSALDAYAEKEAARADGGRRSPRRTGSAEESAAGWPRLSRRTPVARR